MDLKSLRKGWLGKRMNISIQSERKNEERKGKTDVKTHGFKVEKNDDFVHQCGKCEIFTSSRMIIMQNSFFFTFWK